MSHIEVSNVSLIYDTPSGQVPGVADVSFNIEASEFLCIVGPSGCGKSTLLNIIAGFLFPSAGEIRIGGKTVTGHGLDRGVVFQDFAQLFSSRKVSQLIKKSNGWEAAEGRSAKTAVTRRSFRLS